ncbi:MAG: histone deacetylase [Natronomonas sp.]|jgi:acetoin utilization deacetylase AcuC-like enzyme|uniref:histone deacetylase family protein n=1 Tax=Natronomonas sp. TaxID=2184060 RepID=UPI00286FC1F7|nr:histone deacetylase [Natronomonas sp.]MDR9430092.1 histone deacetylase [Natronomonas sp.]
MKFGYREICLEHDTGPRHPETADRIRAIRRGLAKRHGVEYHDGAPADRDAVEAVHDPAYISEIESFCADGGGTWDADTVAVEETWDAALASAGLARWAVEEAIDGSDGRQTPFAIGRPPGHHAEFDEAMGFCFFNNAAIAAHWAVDHAEGVDSAVIFDWDVHHGNGTQDIFYDRDDVFYVSIHEQGLFPGTGEVLETGGPNARKTILNAPLPGGSGDEEYTAVVDELLDPAIERFAPDLFVVSAGFDAHRHDPISRMRVSTEGYGHMTDRVRTIADRDDAALAFVLEGGYGLDALAESVGMVHEVFDGRDPIEPDGDVLSKAERVIEDVRAAHEL